MQTGAIPDGYTFNNGVLSDHIHKTHTDAETARQASVDAQEASDQWRKGWTPNSGPVYPYGLVQSNANPDGYTYNNGVLADHIHKTHTDAEAARQAAVNAQEASDAWRNGLTPNSGPVLSLNQKRAIPDGYTFNNGVLSDHIHKTHTDAETARQAAVDAQEASDAWRKGWTPNSGPVLALNQYGNPADHDTYGTAVNTLGDALKERQDKYYARVLWGNESQEQSDAWRAVPWTPTQKDLGLAAMQKSAIPDGYTFNNGVLSDHIKKTHTDAETARQASVDAQEASDAWRKGWTPNSGPVITYAQQGNPADHDTYSTAVSTLGDNMASKQKVYQDKTDWGLEEQARMDAWRAVPYITKDSDW